jgi:uncharacterized membrane protein YhhN
MKFLFQRKGLLTLSAAHIAAFCKSRPDLSGPDKAVAVALVLGIPAIAYALTGKADVASYALLLGGMATAAFASDFPRSRVALGAAMFAVSDLLIFARMGPMADSAVPHLLVWPLYYFGQFLITVGVIGALGRKGEFTAF